MQFYGALILLMTLSASCALRCYACTGATCTVNITCPINSVIPLDRCATVEANGFIVKSCMNSNLCNNPIKCCSTDLCNSAVPTGYDMVTKGCQTSLACGGAMACCEGNLCNNAIPTGPSVVLLLVSSAIITVFL